MSLLSNICRQEGSLLLQSVERENLCFAKLLSANYNPEPFFVWLLFKESFYSWAVGVGLGGLEEGNDNIMVKFYRKPNTKKIVNI